MSSGPSKKRRRHNSDEDFSEYDAIAARSNANLDAAEARATAEARSAGGGMGGGDVPITNLNNPYSGHAIIAIPDVMADPKVLTYNDVWTAVKLQHPLMGLIADTTTPAHTVYAQMTITKAEMFGASSGMITMTPFLQHPAAYLVGDVSLTVRPYFQGQMKIDVGSIDRRPHLSHTWGDTINSTRMVNFNHTESQRLDPLFSYQIIQKAAAPIPIDAGYIRISWIMRRTAEINLGAAIPILPAPVPPTGDESYDHDAAIRKHTQRTMNEYFKILRINRRKALDLPTLDK